MIDDPCIPFGKHRGDPISRLPIGYVKWLLRDSTSDWVEDHRGRLNARLTYVDPAVIPVLDLEVDQRQASDEIFISLILKGNLMHRLQGGAGYGKSYVCADVVLRAKSAGYQVAACATSYVATENLAKDLDKLGVECGTIASLLRLDVHYDGPKEIFEPGANTEERFMDLLGEGHLLIVDEFSMVSDVVGQALVAGVARYGGRLLVVGDVFQLPSPSQSWDSMLASLEPSSELWLPKRYTLESDLYQVERTARSDPYGFDSRVFLGSEEVVSVGSTEALVDAYVRSYQENPDDQHLMIWHRRVDMVASNRQIRQGLFGSYAEQVRKGESLRVQRTADFTPYYGGEGVRVYSGTTLTVGEVWIGTQSIHIPEAGLHFSIPVHWVDTTTLARYAVIFSVTEKSAEPGTLGADEFNDALRKITTWCRDHGYWGPWRAFRNCFVQVAYQYASTVHRVQGQSVDRIFTCPRALRRADDYSARRLQYVGLTRAKKRLTCL